MINALVILAVANAFFWLGRKTAQMSAKRFQKAVAAHNEQFMNNYLTK